MMLLIFSFNNLNVVEKIKQFEKDQNIIIPELYIDFLKKYNGGYTPKTSFDINDIVSDIKVFFGFDSHDKNYDLSNLVHNDDFLITINNGFLPIAEDSCGNFIIIGIREQNYGEIYFFDNEINKYSYLCSNLKAFILQISSYEYIPRTIEERIQGMKESHSDVDINDELIKLWQLEIDKYSNLKQKVVII